MTDNNKRIVSVSRTIPAPSEVLFDIVANPKRHCEIDGSGTVNEATSGADDKLALGSKFGMKMKQGVPYTIKNTVVEFEEGRLIAWRHMGRHRWRYQFETVEDGTLVTESFDWSTSPIALALELAKFPERHLPNMEKTLERLEEIAVREAAG
jgi:hypothetical protein